MRRALVKTTFREIKNSFGRFIAILAIVALGVGFFSGLRITKPTMISSANDYITENNLYDFRLLSTVGFGNGDIDAFRSLEGVSAAQGAVFLDFVSVAETTETVYKAHSITENINTPQLKYGRLPSSGNECVADSRYFGESSIGLSISVSDSNSQNALSLLKYDNYTIVGIVSDPYYLNYERGTTELGTGTVAGFLYIPESGFNIGAYHEIFITLEKTGYMYSDEYNAAIEAADDEILALCESRTKTRGESLGVTDAQSYVLTRKENLGYACFENDSAIVEGISKVFPVFFFLIAALVCMTTMTRMVSEQRVQIGVLKSMGYSKAAVIGKYMWYSGGAAITGGIAGYIIGVLVIPKVIWQTYKIMYDFGELKTVFSAELAIISIAVSLICSIGATWLSCRHEFNNVPAQLIRPKTPKSGKRIFPERITFIWKRLNFLQKISIRNLFRYKKRFFMMVLGIGGCTALLLTGYGIRDSIQTLVSDQYGEISKYEYTVSFKNAMSNEGIADFSAKYSDEIKNSIFVHESSVTVSSGSSAKTAYMVAYNNGDNISDFYDLHNGKEKIEFPGENEVVISNGLAERLSVSKGDEITVKYNDMASMTLKISGISENYIYYYIYVSRQSVENKLGFFPPINTAYINGNDTQNISETAARFSANENVINVSATEVLRERVEKMLSSLDYIVWLVLVCAGALAFIVLYNLTNINITERIREIATLKVLGFYPIENAVYVFRENIVLTGIGALVGLPLGKLLHAFVMDQIKIDLMTFNVHISVQSVIISLILTFIFAFTVNFFMYFKLGKIDMATSLKSIE